MTTTISISPEDLADAASMVVLLQQIAAKVGVPTSRDRMQDAYDAAYGLFSAMGLSEA